MDRDLLAAAAAAGADVPCEIEIQPASDLYTGRSIKSSAIVTKAYNTLVYEDSAIFDLPNVDDLEVAAAAAAAALEVLAPAPKQICSDSSDDDDSDSDSDDSDDDSTEADSDETSSDESESDDTDSSSDSGRAGAGPVAAPAERKMAAAATTSSRGTVSEPLSLRLGIVTNGDSDNMVEEVVRLHLTYLPASCTGADTGAPAMPRKKKAATSTAAAAVVPDSGDVMMREVETDSDPLSSSSEDEDDVAAAAVAAANRMVDDVELEALDHQGMRELITQAYAAADEDDEEGGGGGAGVGGPRSALEHLGFPAAPPDLSGVELTAEDVLEPAGTCLTVYEGIIVVQGLANSRPLAEGSVIVAEDRTPLGMVEETFGPVAHPLYAFRHPLKSTLPACVQHGAALYMVPRLARLLSVEEIFGSGHKSIVPEPASDDEVYFSDDEAEEHYLRQQVAKRKGAPEGVAAEGGAAVGAGRPRQRSRAVASQRAPGTALQVHATAGIMSALLGLGGGGGGGARGGRHGGGGGGGGRHGGGRGGSFWAGGRHSQSQHQHQAGRGRGGAASGNSGEGRWMRPMRDCDTAQGQPPQHQPPPYQPAQPPPQYYGAGGSQQPPQPYHQHPSPSYNGPQGPPPGHGGAPYQHPPYGSAPQPTGYGASYGQPPQYGRPEQSPSYYYSQQVASGPKPSHNLNSNQSYQSAAHANSAGLGDAGPSPGAGYIQPPQYGNGPSASQPPQYGNGSPSPPHYQQQQQQQQYPGRPSGGPEYFQGPLPPPPSQYGGGCSQPPRQPWW